MVRASLSPGFRFHPTDVELVMYYLKRKLLGKKLMIEAIAEVNLYDFSPWDLPDKSNWRSGDLEWFFFCPKSRKYSSGSRRNRATETGYWKATGKDRSVEYKQKTVAMIKTLVFHLGHAPKGKRTDWVMHEYRMEDKDLANAGVVQDTYVLCRLFEKSGAGPKNGAQYGAPFNEEEWDDDDDVNFDGSSTGAATSALICSHNGLATVDMIVPQSTCSWSVTEPGPSILMSSAIEGHADVPVNDDAMLTKEDIASILGGISNTFDANNEEVEAHGNKVINEDNDVYKGLANLSNLEDLNEGALDAFSIDGADYMMDTFLTPDDLEADLGNFYVG